MLSQDSTKSRKLTRGGFLLDAELGPISEKCLLNALLSSWFGSLMNPLVLVFLAEVTQPAAVTFFCLVVRCSVVVSRAS